MEPGTALVCGEDDGAAAGPGSILTAGGWECVPVQDIERARWLASVRNFRVIVLAGRTSSWCEGATGAVRPRTLAPILALSPRADAQARLLDLGADMVVGADCEPSLLRAAVVAVARHVPSSAPRLRYLEAEGLWLDLWARKVTVDGRPVTLSPTQFELLHILMRHAQVVVRHHALIKAVWSWKYTDERNALRIHVNRLRRRLGEVPGRPRFIRSLRGTGYCFVQPVSEFAADHDPVHGDRGRDGADPLLEGELRKLRNALLGAGDRNRACAALVEIAVSEGLCDAAAVFARRAGSDALHLVAQQGMPAEWQRAVASGIPLAKRFVASDTVSSNQLRAYVDIGKAAGRYGPTARLLADAKLPVLLSVPLVDHYGTWGQLGFARRSDSAFTAAPRMVLEAAGYLLGALFAGDGTPVTAPGAG
ncbi:winged helix-turn-helix domain-containing protein [Actinomadura sp. SCN-SB]|uniref:winged helix-turn-helix domain-containing protein n=1 Tax=Actinomadura sp. SCN-SB TaxID=3373092 RepID=UPI0037534386